MGVDLSSLDPKKGKLHFDTSKLRVNNVIFLVDPDPDGGHIAVLFLSAIYVLMPDLFKQGRVWCVDSPLYAAVKAGKLYRGDTFEQCKAHGKGKIKDTEIGRIKGWGEVSEAYVEPIAFDPAKRKLIRIDPFQSPQHCEYFTALVSGNAVYRRRLLGIE